MQSGATLASILALALTSWGLSLLTCVIGAISFPHWVPTLIQQSVSVKGTQHTCFKRMLWQSLLLS